MKKVLIYSDCFVYSGSENVIENLLKSRLIQQAFSLRFRYAYNQAYQTGIKRKFDGNDAVQDVKGLSSATGYNEEFEGGAIRKGINKIKDVFTLYRMFRDERPDIAIINNGGYPGAASCRLAVIGARMAGVKRIVFIVNNMAYPQKGTFDRLLDKCMGKFVARFVTASEAASAALASERSFNPSACINIPNTLPVDAETDNCLTSDRLRREFGVPDDVIVLGSVGLLTHRKGYHVLIEAMARLAATVEFRLFIFGEGEDRTKLEAAIAENNLQDIVFLPGFKTNILEYVKGLDIFISPSVSNEDFPYVIIEAMMLEKPVIGTRVAGIPEQIKHEITGYVVPPSDPDALAQAILKFSNREQIMKFGKSGRARYFQLFSNSIVMERYKQLLELLLQETKPPV